MLKQIIKLTYRGKIKLLQNATVKCPCCGYIALLKKNNFEICPICFWQDDVLDKNGFSGANGLTLSEAKENFIKFGACDKKMIKNVLPKNIVAMYGRK